MVSDVWNLVNDFFAELDLSYFLVLVVDKFNHFVSIDSHCEVIHIEAGVVFLEVDLVIASSQITHQITKSISVVEKFSID